MKRFLIPALFLLSVSALSQPLPAKTSHSVIIDTDGAIDDLRAISCLLSRPEITVKAILTSDGSVAPEDGAKKAASLTAEFGNPEIPVFCGKSVAGINPPWRQFNMQITWGKETGSAVRPGQASEKLAELLRNSEEKVILVCLGPLTNISAAFSANRDLTGKVEKIIWYTESVKPLKGFNYECDRESTEAVIRSGVRIDVISALGKSTALFDIPLYDKCKKSESKLARVLYFVHSQEPVQERLRQNHFRMADDLAALYLTNPELFSINTLTGKLNVRFNTDYDVAGVREALSDMIAGTYAPNLNIVLGKFPVDKELFRYDIRPLVDSAISLYGMDEWKANVMTDEFHGHLGVFSIVGAKMGIRAREIFGVGPDMLTVVSFAGLRPPYSCLNDGIQVSTGATLGMGLIKVQADSVTKPSAIFSYKGRSVKITLKKEYLEKVDSDINEGILKFGLMDDGYWKLIRHNALIYWLEWDRKKIFDIEEMGVK
jgi:inosine-uridine nucleoside N-ribohydrolase/formylmethanofuran dehydrogenase subunit E